MTQKKVASIRTIAAPVSSPTSRGGLETGRGDSLSQAIGIVQDEVIRAVLQEKIRLRIPRKSDYGIAINPRLRDLDRKLKMFRFTETELLMIGQEVERSHKAWEIECERRARYANKSRWIKP